jgi:hypothetical protein
LIRQPSAISNNKELSILVDGEWFSKKIQPIEPLAKFILGWWHRLPSLCKCLLKVDAALTTLKFQGALY